MNEPTGTGPGTVFVAECECGWVGEGDEPTLIALAQAHGLEVHKFAPEPDQIMAMARPKL